MTDAPARTSTSTSTEIDVVRRFLGALEALDVDAAVELLAPNVVYQNVPLPPARGKDAVEKQLRLLTRYGTGFEVVYDNVASDGPIVLTERTDVLVFGRLRAAFWVCGTFEVRNGKIELWRDRLDYVDVLLSFVRGGVKVLLGSGSAATRR
jgi:limonene-1,2-epoxide hydrolase